MALDTDADLVLHVWSANCGLPTISPVYLATTLYAQLTIPGKFVVEECTNFGPSLDVRPVLVVLWTLLTMSLCRAVTVPAGRPCMRSIVVLYYQVHIWQYGVDGQRTTRNWAMTTNST